MNKLLVIAVLSLVLLIGCSGEESIGVDSTPPHKVRLISHLGDTGDVILDSLYNYYDPNDPEMENNGIDAISDGDKIQIQWEPIIDSDIDYIMIMRFTDEDYLSDTLNFVTCIDTINYLEQTLYYDDLSPIYKDKKLFYFLDVVDYAGNSTVSDTVCYKLMNKPLLNPIANINILSFEWFEEETISAYRILLFDSNHDLIWHYDPQDYDEMPIPYTDPQPLSGHYTWRVDVFGEADFTTFPISGNIYVVKSGAESEEGEFWR